MRDCIISFLVGFTLSIFIINWVQDSRLDKIEEHLFNKEQNKEIRHETK